MLLVVANPGKIDFLVVVLTATYTQPRQIVLVQVVEQQIHQLSWVETSSSNCPSESIILIVACLKLSWMSRCSGAQVGARLKVRIPDTTVQSLHNTIHTKRSALLQTERGKFLACQVR